MTDQEFLNVQKKVWAAMMEHGTVLQYDPVNQSESSAIWRGWNQYRTVFDGTPPGKVLPKNVGQLVDWQKTTIPDYHEMNEFVDSDSPGNRIDILAGVLFLTTGDQYLIATSEISDILRFHQHELVKNQNRNQPVEIPEDLVSKWNL